MMKLLHVVRPHIVVGGFLGYVAGVLYALNMGGATDWTSFFAGYLIVLFMDLSTHFNNDYFDVEADQHQPFKPFGNKNIFLEHPELMKTSLYASAASTIISLVIATVMLRETSWHLLAIAALFNILGWLYSTPPVKLGSRRLGEVTIAVGTGFCVPAVGYIMAIGGLTDLFIPFMVPLILYGFILSLCLQIPDYEVDREMGKKTIVGWLGRKRTYLLVSVCCLVSSTIFLVVFNLKFVVISLFPFFTSLLGLRLSEDHDDAKNYTKQVIITLFIYLIGLDVILLLYLV